MWGLMVEEGIWHPPGGTRGLADRLVSRFGARGSDGCALRLSSPARQVLVERGQVAGVQLEDGEVLRSARVICNTDYRVAVASLLPADALPSSWRAAVLGAKVTCSNIQVCLGVRAADVDLSAFAQASRLITRREDAAQAPAKAPAPQSYAKGELELSLLTAEDSSLAPPGGAVIVLRAEAKLEDFQAFGPASDVRTEAYAGHKQALATELIAAAAELTAPGYALLMNQERARRAELRARLLARYAELSPFLERYARGSGPFLFERYGLAEVVYTPFFQRFYALEHYEGFELPDAPEYRRARDWVDACRAQPQAQQVTREQVIKLYYDYARGAGNGALAPGRARSSFAFAPDWRARPWPPREKYAGALSDAELGLV